MYSPKIVSLVGRTAKGSSSSLPPPMVTMASSGLKPFDVLGFALEVVERDEEREVRVLGPARLDAGVHLGDHPLPDGVAVGPDHHRAAHRAVLGHLGLGHDVLVPAREVLRLRSEHAGHPQDVSGAGSLPVSRRVALVDQVDALLAGVGVVALLFE